MKVVGCGLCIGFHRSTEMKFFFIFFIFFIFFSNGSLYGKHNPQPY